MRIIGGGSQHKLLNQMTANATGRTVISGPVEATAIGNLLMQMLAMGDIDSLAEGRALVRHSFAHESETFQPEDPSAWESARRRWNASCRKT